MGSVGRQAHPRDLFAPRIQALADEPAWSFQGYACGRLDVSPGGHALARQHLTDRRSGGTSARSGYDIRVRSANPIGAFGLALPGGAGVRTELAGQFAADGVSLWRYPRRGSGESTPNSAARPWDRASPAPEPMTTGRNHLAAPEAATAVLRHPLYLVAKGGDLRILSRIGC
jgi:hypothetical protein